MMNKRGTHLEIVISFVLFITFLMFLLIITSPLIKKEGKEDVFSNKIVIEKIMEKISANFIVVSISNESYADSGNANCVKINNTRIGTNNLLYSIVKDKDGNIINSSKSGEYLMIEWNSNKTFYKLYYSEEYLKSTQTTNNNCTLAKEGLIRSKKYVSERRVREAVSNYEANYNRFKNDLSIPSNIEFSFSFMYSNGTSLSTKESDVSGGIYVKESKIEYIDDSADINFGSLKVKTW
ncbi:MAG: hypothetical protein AABW81_03525 [Nanoarchaeota archaeon]